MKILLVSLLVIRCSALWASIAATKIQMVTLEVHDQSGHLQGSVEIPRDHADLSITVKNLLNDCSGNQTENVHLPLYPSGITLETFSCIKRYLEDLSSYLKQDDRTQKDTIKHKLQGLSVSRLFDLLRGLNYLSIPQLLTWGIEVAQEKPITDIPFAQIVHLLISNAQIKYHLEKISGITYEKSQTTQVRQDDDEDTYIPRRDVAIF